VYAAIRQSSHVEHLQGKGIKFIDVDFSNKAQLISALDAAPEFDSIIHNAGITKALRKKSFFEVNYQYTKNLAEAISQSHQNPLRFVYISSLSAGGPGISDCSSPISVFHPSEPITNYGLSKLQAEQFICQQLAFPFLIIRPTAVYGPGDKDFFSLVKLINKHWDLMIGRHKQSLSFIYVKDLSLAIFNLLETSAINITYIASDGEAYSKTYMSDTIASIMQKRVRRVYVPLVIAKIIALFSEGISIVSGKPTVLSCEKIKEFSARNWNCDISSLENDINFKVQYSLEQGLKETIDWYRANGWIK
jgi:UDP-glucose 4-epimerase